jgi:hypothetical protein
MDFGMQIQMSICGEGSDTRIDLVSASRRPCPQAIVRYRVQTKKGLQDVTRISRRYGIHIGREIWRYDESALAGLGDDEL